MPSVGRTHALAALALMLGVLVLMLYEGTWPQVFMFATDPDVSALNRLFSVPVHLSDDVMITLRTGRVLLETGVPSINVQHLAQASTSYLMPYVFAPLILVLPTNVAVMAYAGLGVLAVLMTLSAIVYFAKSVVNGVVLAIALAMTSTNLEYALNGWDHLFQGAVFAAAMVLSRAPNSTRRLILIGALLAAGSLLRPDGAILALGILVVTVTGSENRRRAALIAGGTALGLGVAMLLINLAQFGHLTPTTTRLKLGAAPDWDYIWNYARTTAFGSFTALTILIALLAFVAVFHRALDMRVVSPIVVTVILTSMIALYNSDVFVAGRMFWASAVVLAMVIGAEAPAIVHGGLAYRDLLFPPGRPLPNRSKMLGALAAVGLMAGIGAAGVVGLRGAVVSAEAVGSTGESTQFVLAEWANEHLDSASGPIGLFYAGTSFHLPQFEVADFLGKGDEVIAVGPTHRGTVGHNKWDIDSTLTRWNPQAILPTFMVDIDSTEGLANAERWISEQWILAYNPELFLNARVQADYRRCYVRDVRGTVPYESGLLLRNDIVSAVGQAARCIDWPDTTGTPDN